MQLTELRRKAGLTQEELGRLSAPKTSRATAHQPRIASYEQGVKQMTLATAQRIVRVLNRHLKRRGDATVARLEDLLPRKTA